MDGRELTPEQARQIAALRRRNAGADLRAHARPWGVIVEVRRAGRTVELHRFDFTGASAPDRRLAA